MFKISTVVAALFVAALMGPACSSSGFKSRAGDAGAASGGQAGGTISGVTRHDRNNWRSGDAVFRDDLSGLRKDFPGTPLTLDPLDPRRTRKAPETGKLVFGASRCSGDQCLATAAVDRHAELGYVVCTASIRT
jgi:hypothetical protein